MPPSAPRYDVRIVELVCALDDPALPIAELCRRVGTAAERIGLTRPSYSHVRRLALAERERLEAERERREQLRRIADDVVVELLTARVPNPYYYSERLDRART